ncbi:MAG: hypothetical protein KC620_12915 [Myxococcales bacterium]|nr:hypothetical protein [Myxococcales bacterium]
MRAVTLIGLLLAVVLTGCLEDFGDPRPQTSVPPPEDGADAGETPDAGEPPPPAERCDYTFVYRHTEDGTPGEVRLAGSFEGWQGGVVMDGPSDAGEYVATVDLAEGRHAYKFIVDGNWIADAENPEAEDDGQGGMNSLVQHVCPFAPDCVQNADCDGEGVCRHYACGPCECPMGRVCNDAGRCVGCTANADCEGGDVCRDGACGPCLADEECGDGLACVDLACVEPECTTDAECDLLTEVCRARQCAAKPCNLRVFTFDPGGAAYDRVLIAGTFTNWQDGAVPMQQVNGIWVGRVEIEDGRHLYKFITYPAGAVDPVWIEDPGNPEVEADPFGGRNSVVTVNCRPPCENDDECEGGYVCLNGQCGPAPVAGECGDPDVFDWRDAVMYFAMVDRFYDSDGRNDPVQGASDGPGDGASGQYEGGDLPGMIAKVPYLHDLGVTAVWLSAPYENRNTAGAAIDPNADQHQYSGYHGYWPSPANVNYANPDDPQPVPQVETRIGTADDLHAFIDAVHGEGMFVLFDYVMNHVDSESGLYRAHPDWFARGDGRDGRPADGFALCGPLNLWDDDYWGKRCAFTDYLPPFDFTNDAARNWSVADALWWAKTYGIDGYRLDAIKHVEQSWLIDLRDGLDAAFPDPAGGRFYLVGETFAYDNAGLIRQFIDPAEKLDGQFDFPFKARLCEGIFHGGLNNFQGWMDFENSAFYPPGTLMTTWIGNHDIPRAIHFASGQLGNCREGSSAGNGWTSASFPQPADARPYELLGLAFGVMMTNPGIPLIYYGDEIGLAGGGDPDNRRMMVWDDGRLNAHQRALRDRIARMGRIRAENKALSRGQRFTISANGDTWVYRMGRCDDERLPDITVAINRADQPREVGIPAGGYVELMTDAMIEGGQVQVPARSMLILRAAE